jgi:type II secretory pathway component PulC
VNVMHYSRDCPPKSLVLITVLVFAACFPVLSEYAAAETSPSASVIRATPYFVGGTQRGYRLFPISDRALYEAMGLRPGDLLLEIDGRPMVEPRAHLELFERLDSGESVIAKIRRADEIVEVTLQIR